MPAYPKPGYRAQPRPSGFQRPKAGFGVPANDNWRVPKPANDNIPRPIKGAGGRIAAGLRLGWAGIGIYTAYEAWRWLNPGGQPGGTTAIAPDYGPWTLKYTCNGGGVRDAHRWELGAGPNLNFCPTNQAVDQNRNQASPPNPNPQNYTAVVFLEWTSCPGYPGATVDTCPAANWRVRYSEVWTRPAGAVVPLPNFGSAGIVRLPYTIPAFNPAYNPAEWPILQPVPLPRPLPYSQVNRALKRRVKAAEWQSPTRFVPRPVRSPVAPNPVKQPLAPQAPNVAPPRVEVYPRPRLLPGSHRNAPPPKGTKERKFILSPRQDSAIGILMNTITESNDFVEALYYAIPADKRPKGRLGLHEKAQQVYLHYKDIDIEQALNNLLQNQVGDTIGGIRGRLNARANRAAGLATGLRPTTF